MISFCGFVLYHVSLELVPFSSVTLVSDADVAAKYYTVGHKNVPLCFCPYICQLLSIFQNSFTGTLCRQFAVTWLLHIPPHPKCVSRLPCEISMKYAYITIITNRHFGKIEKKTLQTNIAVNGLYDTRLGVYNTVKCCKNHSSQRWSETFFFIYLNFCYYH